MESDGPIKIVSVGQFRPEKDHALQIRAMFELRQIVDDAVWKRVRFEILLITVVSYSNDNFFHSKESFS